MTEKVHFHAPKIELSLVDCHNRMAAATGSATYAQAASNADYNGHAVTVQFNDYTDRYVCFYSWSGTQYLARGSFDTCVDAAMAYYARGHRGASAMVTLEGNHGAAIAYAQTLPGLLPGKLPREPAWWTWRHKIAAQSGDRGNRAALAFDLKLLESAESEEDYVAELRKTRGWIYER